MTWPGCWEVNRRDCTSADASTNELIFFWKHDDSNARSFDSLLFIDATLNTFIQGCCLLNDYEETQEAHSFYEFIRIFFSLSFFFRSLKSLIAVSQYLLNSLFLCAEFARKHYNTTWIMFPLDLSLFFIYYWYC